MDISHHLLLPDGRLRAGWRVFLFVGLYLLALTLSAWLLRELFDRRWLAYSVLAQLSATLAATALMLHFFDRQPFWSIGLQPAGAGRGMGGGFLLGFLMAEAVILFEVAAGLVTIQSAADLRMADLAVLAPACILLLVAAATEEVLFRGYPFQRLVEATGGLGAIAISSALFGLLHGGNPDASLLSIVNTMLAGVLFSVAYLRTRALWLPMGAHFAWNWTLAVSGFPVSGLRLAEVPWQAESASEKLWLYGGSYGPEGGLAATVVLLAGTGLVASGRIRLFRQEEPTGTTPTGTDGLSRG